MATRLDLRDRLGAVRVRLGFFRGRHRIDPGLYAVGTPHGRSPVLVSANYKLSFDRLRETLGGRDLWILVLDTRGINVWCAAGKGSFGTEELVARVAETRLAELLDERVLILPQLGAPGVAAHDVTRRTGFRVFYGPVRASDLPSYLDDGCRASMAMRRVRFDWIDRLVLVPVELRSWGGWALLVGALLAFGLRLGAFDWRPAAAYLLLFAAAGAGGPLLLPLLPGGWFALRGALLGVLLFLGALGGGGFAAAGAQAGTSLVAWFFLVVATASFLLMQFTGCSTFTSVSGVRHEVRRALPAQAMLLVAGLLVWFWKGL